MIIKIKTMILHAWITNQCLAHDYQDNAGSSTVLILCLQLVPSNRLCLDNLTDAFQGVACDKAGFWQHLCVQWDLRCSACMM